MPMIFKIDDCVPENNQQWRKDGVTDITNNSSESWAQTSILNISVLIVYATVII